MAPDNAGADFARKLAESLRVHLRQFLATRRALGFVWRAAPGWSLVTAGAILLNSILPVALLLLLRLLVDALAKSGLAGAMPSRFSPLAIMLFMGAVALLQSIAGALSRVAGEVQAQAVADYMNGIVNRKSTEVDLAYYELPGYQDSLHRAQAQAAHRPRRIVSNLIGVVQNGVLLCAMCGVLVSYHWLILPVLGLASVPGILLRMRGAARFYDAERRATADERRAAYYAEILSAAHFAKDVRLLDLGPVFHARFDAVRRVLRRSRIRLVWRRATGAVLVEICAIVGMSAIFAVMVHSVMAGVITIGSLFMYFTAMQRAWTHVGGMMSATSELYEDNLFLSELYEFLEMVPTIADPPEPRAFPAPISSGIVLDRVSFRYPGSTRLALDGISLTIGPGEHIALVGENGSGKTTLVKLLCRLYDATDGAIRVDGIDLRQFRVRDVRRAIGLLLQDYTRFALTARENIWLGQVTLDADDPKIAAAACEADAEGIIRSLPHGLDTVLGNRFKDGEELSGGEWQRMALARLYLGGAPVLILDEPTSALDPQAEEEVLVSFAAAARRHTTITISHRFSAVRHADRIYVMAKGRIVEAGNHDELLRAHGVYARLFRMQARRYAEAPAAAAPVR